jgi:hypothetical protein
MSTTTDGYEERMKRKVDAIKLLKKPEVWLEESGRHGHDEDMEEGRDLLDIVRRLSRAGRHKGKGRAA